MWIARVACSDSECPEEIEAEARDLRELEALACACGCAMAIVGWPDCAPSSPAAGACSSAVCP